MLVAWKSPAEVLPDVDRGEADDQTGDDESRGRTRSMLHTAHTPLQTRRRTAGNGTRWLTVVGARHNNLRNVTVHVPLERFVCVTGVSGSGKSSLVNDIIRETLARDLNGATDVHPGAHDRIEGREHLDKVIDIDQSPIGRTPRSNPATYIKVFDEIRTLFAKLPDARVRGYRPARFSFNVQGGQKGGGRCEACEGNGSNRMEMDFLADIWVTCPVCAGHRFNRETLQIRYKDKSIADVLEMDVQQAREHFANVPKIEEMLGTLHGVGLDYLKLGQSSTTLSGGEAQRIKLARELVKKATGRTFYVLDEPTTGLHFADIKRLLAVLHGFVDAGNSVVVIEHNLDVIKTADWVIDLGPEGGASGGLVVACGTPEDLTNAKTSHTGAALREMLARKRRSTKTAERQKARTSTSRTPRQDFISVVGAKQHNLKNITVDVPRGRTTVCCGPSGSGKSSFAIDTVYSEGQRRYVESLSAYARQFLSRLQPPRVDHVYGLSPAICIEQKTTSKSPRSTVGTITEIYDYMRVLWARLGQPYCPRCQVPIGTQTSDEIIDKVLATGEGRHVLLLAPLEPMGQESFEQLLEREQAKGFRRVRVDGTIRSLDEPIDIDRKRRHRVELVVDRVRVRRSQAARLADSVEQALSMGNGVMVVQFADADAADTRPVEPGTEAPIKSGTEYRFSQHCSCPQCGISYEQLSSHHFSFNSRLGWCEACEGLGTQQGTTPAAVILHPTKSIINGAVAGWRSVGPVTKLYSLLEALADHIGIDLDRPWNQWSEKQRLALLHGCGDTWIKVKAANREDHSNPRLDGDGLSAMRFQWLGFFPAISRATRSSWQYRKRLEELVTEVACDACAGSRLRPEAAAVRFAGATIHEACLWPLSQVLPWFEGLALSVRERKIAGELIHEITSRLRFLVEVGLDYLSLHRTASTLSGGESQRIQLASQIGTGLTGVLYVLDEPTIGLHPRDNARLIRALRRLRDLGNTLLLVEHDREIIDSADHVLDFGPGAGTFGGAITAAASPKQLRSRRASLTGRYLAGKSAIPVPDRRRPVPLSVQTPRAEIAGRKRRRRMFEERMDHVASGEPFRWLTVLGAREHNLQEVDVAFPLGRFICVTGVSGSGKSTLVSSILYNALAARIHRARLVPGGHQNITGVEHIDKVINVDQSPIGNSPTSNPATCTGLFDVIRALFARLPLSKIRGYSANRFSFNRPGGRCEACQGMGQRCIEMHFLPDVWIECENCKSTRYGPETLDVRYRQKSIADVLDMPVSKALELFENVPKVRTMLHTLSEVGLGYVKLGQPAPTLSGGEAQRVKLAAELGRPSTGRTLYILDEPTTGLHFDDLRKLLAVLHGLVDLGNTCICIEHNLDIIKTADWVIDLGPEAGAGGGRVIIAGTPETVAGSADSHTGAALKPVLRAGPIASLSAGIAPKVRVTSTPTAASLDALDDVQMPWERDGKAWHTVAHVDYQGTPVQWDPALLVWLVGIMERAGSFKSADWNHRSRVELKAAGDVPWFCHLLTGSKDLLEVAWRVPQGTFTQTDLDKQLQIKTLDERQDLPIYGQWSRLRVSTPRSGWQEVRMYLRDFQDVKKAGFRSFLQSAARAYRKQVAVAQADPAQVQPWKTQGQQWHLSQKSIHPGHIIRWKPDVLQALIGRFKALQTDLSIDWTSQTAVQLVVAPKGTVLGKIVTNLGRGLRVELRAPSGAFTPAQIELLGEDAVIIRQDGYDRIVFRIRSFAQCDARQLREVWHRCRGGPSDERLQTA